MTTKTHKNKALDEGDTLTERAESRARQTTQLLEARRLVLKAIEAGVSKEAMLIEQADFKKMIRAEYYRDEKNIPIVAVANKLSAKIFDEDSYLKWGNSAITIFIDGGMYLSRLMAGQVCLNRAILSCAGRPENTYGAMLNFSELMIRLSEFARNRMVLLDNLKQLPSLFLYEVNHVHAIRDAADAPALLDSVLIERAANKRPTIFSCASTPSDIATMGNRVGSIFSSIVTSVQNKNCLPFKGDDKSDILHIRLEG